VFEPQRNRLLKQLGRAVELAEPVRDEESA
jgi:hypothetical protein